MLGSGPSIWPIAGHSSDRNKLFLAWPFGTIDASKAEIQPAFKPTLNSVVKPAFRRNYGYLTNAVCSKLVEYLYPHE
jgi:hypothetical protein